MQQTFTIHTGLYSKAAYFLIYKALKAELVKKRRGIFYDRKARKYIFPRFGFSANGSELSAAFRDRNMLFSMFMPMVSDNLACIAPDGEVTIECSWYDWDNPNVPVFSMQRFRNAVLDIVSEKNLRYIPDQLFNLFDGDVEKVKCLAQFIYDFLKTKSIAKTLSGKRKYDPDFAAAVIGKPLNPFTQKLLEIKRDELRDYFIDCLDITYANKPTKKVFLQTIDELLKNVLSLLS